MQDRAEKTQGSQSKDSSAALLLLAAPRAEGPVKHLLSLGMERETFPV